MFLSVRTKQKDVVEAEVTNSGKIKLIANEMPSQQNTEVEVVYDNEDKGIKKSITIPVKITDFNPMSLEQLNGYWCDEKVKTKFVKIDKKSKGNIDFQVIYIYEIDYIGDVQFNAFKQNKLSGKMKYIQAYADENLERLPAEDFTLEKVSANKIIVHKGKDVLSLTKSSKKELEAAQQLTDVGENQGTDTQPNQDANVQPNQGANTQPSQKNKINGRYANLQSDSELDIDVSVTVIDDKNATIQVEQNSNNSHRLSSSLMGMFETNAVEQNESTWTFSWTDNNGTKGTGTNNIPRR